MEESFKQLITAGYRARPAEFEDLPQVVPLVNAAEVEMTGASDWTVERWEEEWRQGGIDLAASTRVVIAPDGSMVGCIELCDETNPPARPWIWGRVHPQWKGRGIGSAMLTWALSTSLRALNRLPDDARLAPYVAAPAHHKPSVELFENMGMSVCRHAWHMLMDLDAMLPEPPWPAGLQVRALRYPDDLEAAFQALDEAFFARRGWCAMSAPSRSNSRRPRSRWATCKRSRQSARRRRLCCRRWPAWRFFGVSVWATACARATLPRLGATTPKTMVPTVQFVLKPVRSISTVLAQSAIGCNVGDANDFPFSSPSAASRIATASSTTC